MADCGENQLPGQTYAVGGEYRLSGNTANGTAVWFDGGRSFPAGTYRLRYVDGCLRFNGSTFGWGVAVSVGDWQLVSGSVAAPVDLAAAPCRPNPVPSPSGLYGRGGWDTPEAAVAANRGAAALTLEHGGGPLGLRLRDDAYFDNVGGNPRPTWSLQQLGECEQPPAFQTGKCGLPFVPRIPELPVIRGCEIPTGLRPIPDCPDVQVPVVPPEPPPFTCPQFQFQINSSISQAEVPSLHIAITPSVVRDAYGDEACGFQVQVQLQVPYAQDGGSEGPQGPTGPQGSTGPTGPSGGTSGYGVEWFYARITDHTSVGTNRWKYDWEQVEPLADGTWYAPEDGRQSIYETEEEPMKAYNTVETNNSSIFGNGINHGGSYPAGFAMQPIQGHRVVQMWMIPEYGSELIVYRFSATNAEDGSCP